MKGIKCTIIRDVLPLYIDDVVSDDTAQMVKEHLNQCQTCQKEYEQMTQTLYVPIETKISLFQRINQKWLRKKIIIIVTAVVITSFLLFGIFSYVLYYGKTISYSPALFDIEELDEKLLVHYYGKSYAKVSATHPMSIEINGEQKKVSFIYYTESITNSVSRNLFNNKSSSQNYIFELPDSGSIDEVYYAEFDSVKIVDKKDSWENVLERAILIWEK